MMRRLIILLAFLLLCPIKVEASLLLSGGSTAGTSCPPPTVNGSTISPTNFNCTLTDSFLGNYQFQPPALSLGNYLLNNTRLSFNAVQATLGTRNDGSGENGIYYLQNFGPLSIAPFQEWFVWIHHNIIIPATAPSSHIDNTYFLDVTNPAACTGSQGCYTLAQLASRASNGDTLEIKAPPAGIPVWYMSGEFTANNLTLNADAGTFVCCASIDGGFKSAVDISGNNFTLNGGKWGHHHSGGSTYSSHANTNAQNPTWENLTAFDDDTCLSDGGNNGFTTIGPNVLTYLCGQNGQSNGQDHDVYLSAEGCGIGGTFNPSTGVCIITGPPDPSCFNIHDSTFLQVQSGGWNLKLRQGCGTSTNVTACGTTTAGCIKNNIIGCDDPALGSGNTPDACRMHAPIDFPCGGNYLVQSNVINGVRYDIPGGNGWTIMRFAEEVSLTNQLANCPQYGWYPSYSVQLDRNIIFFDSPVVGGGSSQISVVCLAGQTGGVCNQNAGAGWTCKLTNNVLVSNYPIVPRMVPGPGCTDGGRTGCTPTGSNTSCTDADGNIWYDNRMAAAAGQGWNGTSYTSKATGVTSQCTVGNGCSWPYLPAHS